MRICHFEDRRTADLGPLTLTRPSSELLCGLNTLGAKQRRYFGKPDVVGHLCRPAVTAAIADGFMPVNDPLWLRGSATVLVNGRWLPPNRPSGRSAPTFAELIQDGPYVAFCQGDVAFAVLDQDHLLPVSPATIDDCLDDWLHTLPLRDVGGQMIRYPWELVDRNANQIIRDFEVVYDPEEAGLHPTGFFHVGPADRLLLDPTAVIEPMVVADTTHGPVVIGPHAHVTAFTRLEGPCTIGAGTHVLGAKIRAGTTLGPNCRIGGEVECSIVHGFTNKYHDGFLGHSYVGEWVNLAAGTTTGDLRNDYQPIAVPLNGVHVPTGLTKVGSFIGDHARTGLNVLLNCGTVVGAFAQILPTGQFAPRAVPSFSRFGPNGLNDEIDVEQLLTTADTVMRRRGKELTPAMEGLYRSLRDGRSEVREAFEGPRLRKSA
jgi:UDP-N-acetylglucosamine diphosphorylase/glucosamine-1-phosphate N-acetyltransferase